MYLYANCIDPICKYCFKFIWDNFWVFLEIFFPIKTSLTKMHLNLPQTQSILQTNTVFMAD